MSKLILNADSTEEKFSEVYSLEVGDVFKVSSDYETVIRRIEEDYLPPHLEFKVFPINPGTDLYTMYGADHCVVTHKRIIG